MGWRSWNCYHQAINQEKMTTAANAFVDASRGSTLKDVGYINVGLDDYYQLCHAGAAGSFHNASGYPIIDHTKFPDMKAMTDHAHSLGLRMGWYGNNCGCNEHESVPSWGPGNINHYKGDVQATIDFGFDGIKLDGCGEFRNLTLFAELFNATNKPIMIENCHWGGDGPGSTGGLNPDGNPDWCPFNFFRTSGDIGPSWGSVMGNLQTVVKWQPWDGPVKTGPGCWAYPDMLEVGNLPTFNESRAHFGAWCIVSAPLILGHDLNNTAVNDAIWPIITNKHAIAVSQSYAGHPGSLISSTPPPSPPPGPPSSTDYLWGVKPDPTDKTQHGWTYPKPSSTGPVENSGLCVTIAKNANTNDDLTLTSCTGAPEQTFEIDANGNVHISGDTKRCLALYNFDGPKVVSYACNTGVNEVFTTSGDTICSKNGYCLAARPKTPPGGGGGGGGGSSDIQIWAKPQPTGAVAVLVLNGDENGAHAVDIDLAAVNVSSTSSFSVFDIWTEASLPGVAKGSFTTDSIAPHDSRFYVFTPSSTEE